MRKVFLSGLSAICLLIFLFSACARKEKIIIFSTSGISDWLSAEKKKKGGFAVLKKAIKKENHNSIVLDMGHWLTYIPEGRQRNINSIIACMNSVGYSLAIPGNKDLSFKPKNLNAPLKNSKFPIIASNTYLRTGARPQYAKARHILKLKNTAIGFFSINTFDAENMSAPKKLPFYRLEKENYEIARNVAELKKTGSKIIVMLLNIEPKKGLKFKKLCKFIASGKNAPDMVIINGLTQKKQLKINRTYFVNQTEDSSSVLRIKTSINPQTGKLAGVSSKILPLDKKDLGEDLKILKLETAHIKKLSGIFNKKIGSSTDKLERAPKGISSLANWIALSMKKWSRAKGAIITSDKLKEDISVGVITKRDLYNILDYNTYLVYLKVRGDGLRAIINANLDKGIGLAGITLSLKNNTAQDIKVGNRRLKAAKIYQIAIADYMLNEEKYHVLPHAIEFVNKPKSIIDILKWQIRRTRYPISITGSAEHKKK